ncbi:MAG: ATP-binding protein [Labrys sp. (in: a-proteobacteria)]
MVEAKTERKRRWPSMGLPGKLLLLTILFVMIAEVLIYVPSVANFRHNWLNDRISRAQTAALVLEAAPDGMVPEALAQQLLDGVGAETVALKMQGARRLLALAQTPPEVAMTIDLRETSRVSMIVESFDILLFGGDRTVRLLGEAMKGGDFIEIVFNEKPLRVAMLEFSRNILFLSLAISAITASLVYAALTLVIVGPMRRLTRAIMLFGQNPEDASRVIEPSGRNDEIGVAERELAAMQRQLVGTLQQKNRLAALGLAVSKINHDLRNLLSSAQLFSDRLADSNDPMVQRFAPRLLSALDRAIAFCQSTLSYGRVIEPPPVRRAVPLAPLVMDVRDLLGISEETAIGFVIDMPEDLTVDADPEQLSRILINLCRNAAQALSGIGATRADRDQIRVAGRRQGRRVMIDVIDTGPGVPPQARDRLFEAFQGSTRAGGSGLGLAIAAELARAHGGAVTLLDSERGAVFRIEIPDRI